LRKPSVALGNGVLDFQSATQGVYRTSKFDKGPITRSFDDASRIFRNFWLDEFAAVRLECGQRAFLIGAHQTAVTGNIGREDGSQPSFDSRLGHKGRPRSTVFRAKLMVEGWDVSIEATMCALGQKQTFALQ
jgi:hypothetical protein